MKSKEPYKISFFIPGLPRTTNSGGRAHWAMKAKEARFWKNCVHLVTVGKRPESPLKKARLTLVRYSSAECDFDGLVSSFKHVIDGLKDSGIIENDKQANLPDPKYLWEKAPPKKGQVFIAVEEIRE